MRFTFTVVVVLTLAVGIGANTAVFSVLDGVLLKPLAYPRAEELVALRQIAPGATGSTSASDGLNLSLSMYLTYAERRDLLRGHAEKTRDRHSRGAVRASELTTRASPGYEYLVCVGKKKIDLDIAELLRPQQW